jgi:hypothetical protein
MPSYRLCLVRCAIIILLCYGPEHALIPIAPWSWLRRGRACAVVPTMPWSQLCRGPNCAAHRDCAVIPTVPGSHDCGPDFVVVLTMQWSLLFHDPTVTWSWLCPDTDGVWSELCHGSDYALVPAVLWFQLCRGFSCATVQTAVVLAVLWVRYCLSPGYARCMYSKEHKNILERKATVLFIECY